MIINPKLSQMFLCIQNVLQLFPQNSSFYVCLWPAKWCTKVLTTIHLFQWNMENCKTAQTITFHHGSSHNTRCHISRSNYQKKKSCGAGGSRKQNIRTGPRMRIDCRVLHLPDQRHPKSAKQRSPFGGKRGAGRQYKTWR